MQVLSCNSAALDLQFTPPCEKLFCVKSNSTYQGIDLSTDPAELVEAGGRRLFPVSFHRTDWQLKPRPMLHIPLNFCPHPAEEWVNNLYRCWSSRIKSALPRNLEIPERHKLHSAVGIQGCTCNLCRNDLSSFPKKCSFTGKKSSKFSKYVKRGGGGVKVVLTNIPLPLTSFPIISASPTCSSVLVGNPSSLIHRSSLCSLFSSGIPWNFSS